MKDNNSVHPSVTVLLSGGIDSAACVALYREQNFAIRSVFIDYGQVAAQKELQAAKSIATHYHIPFEKLRWSGLKEKEAGLISGRNAFLLIGALMELSDSTRIMALGIHSGTNYCDCTPSFIQKMQSVFDIYTGGVIQIGAPFLKWTKQDIWAFCKTHDVPVNLTYSCERGADQPCGVCLSCSDLEALYACT